MTLYWFIAAAVIILPLAIYAAILLRKLKLQQVEQEKKQQAHQAGLNAHDTKIYDSVIIIANAMQEKQCDFSEGCWRISVLLDSLHSQAKLADKFPAIFELYDGIKHLSILDDRKKLAKHDRMKQDLERMKLEAKLTDAITEEVNHLQEFAKAQREQLAP